jgi:hypothetical protein
MEEFDLADLTWIFETGTIIWKYIRTVIVCHEIKLSRAGLGQNYSAGITDDGKI